MGKERHLENCAAIIRKASTSLAPLFLHHPLPYSQPSLGWVAGGEEGCLCRRFGKLESLEALASGGPGYKESSTLGQAVEFL